MSTFKHPIEIGDSEGSRFEKLDALVDTGSTYSVIPKGLLHRLGVVPETTREFELADGSVQELDIGETRVRVLGRTATSVVVFGADEESPLIGAYTLEGLALAADPVQEKLVPTRALLK